MTGSRASYTMRTADVIVQYAADPRCIAVGFLPTGTINAVVVNCHGGGWIAQTNAETWRHDPAYELEGTAAMDEYMAAGVAVYWIEYPYGWQANGDARFFPCSNFPQIPRAIGRAIQFLKTHRADGQATGSLDRVLPDADYAYAVKGDSAGALMALYVALQPDGWLDYDPSGRVQALDKWAYTRSHRVSCAFAYGTPIDLRRYEASVAALPYFGPSSRFHGTAIPDSVVAALSGFGKFTQVPERQKYAATPTSLAEARLRGNLDVSLMVSNGLSGSESSFLKSGIVFEFDPADITGAAPTAGIAISASGGATGTVRAYYAQDSSDLYLICIDANAGAGDIVANWTGTLSWSGGSVSLTGVTVTGNDSYRTFIGETALLAVYDADNDPLPTTGPHSVNYVPAFKRERKAHYTAAAALSLPVTDYDRWYCGNAYTASLLTGYDGAAFGHNGIGNIAVELDMFEERGVTF
jgi:hypothetical protein